MPMHWNLVSDDQVTALQSSEQYLAFSDAYLEAAIGLCSELVRDNAKTTYTRGAVPMFLAFQATELFLKGAILRRDSGSSLASSHKIEPLLNRYRKLYPSKKFAFSNLFSVVEPDLSGLAVEVVNKYRKEKLEHEKKNPNDQRYRYPQNKSGQPWAGTAGFEANLFLKDLQQLRREIDAIVSALGEEEQPT